MLAEDGRSTSQFGLPTVPHDTTEYKRLVNAFSTSEKAQVHRDMSPNFTNEQKNTFDKVTTSALQSKGGVYIDAPAGTGNSYTINMRHFCEPSGPG